MSGKKPEWFSNMTQKQYDEMVETMVETNKKRNEAAAKIRKERLEAAEKEKVEWERDYGEKYRSKLEELKTWIYEFEELLPKRVGYEDCPRLILGNDELNSIEYYAELLEDTDDLFWRYSNIVGCPDSWADSGC